MRPENTQSPAVILASESTVDGIRNREIEQLETTASNTANTFHNFTSRCVITYIAGKSALLTVTNQPTNQRKKNQ